MTEINIEPTSSGFGVIRPEEKPTTFLKEAWHLIKALPDYIVQGLERFTITERTRQFMDHPVEDLDDVPVCGDTLARHKGE